MVITISLLSFVVGESFHSTVADQHQAEDLSLLQVRASVDQQKQKQRETSVITNY